jgi:hypothetical protein
VNQEEWTRTRPRPRVSGLHAQPYLDPWPLCTDVECRAPAEVTWQEIRMDPDPSMYLVTSLRCTRCEERERLQTAWSRDCKPDCPCGCQEPPS